MTLLSALGMKISETTKKEGEKENDEEEDAKRRKTRGGGGEKYGRKKKREDVGKEALDDDDDENEGQRDIRRSRRGDVKTSAHPLLSLTLYIYSLFSLSIFHYYIFCIILTKKSERTVLVIFESSPRTSHLPRLTIP